MATIYKEIKVNAPAQFVWDAIKDVGAVHSRLAKGFVTNTVLEDDVRTVTFANGVVVREQIIAISNEHRRLAYFAIGGRSSHHNAYLQVSEVNENTSLITWVTDLLPEEMKNPIEQMVEVGSAAIQKTVESAYAGSK